MPAICTPQPPSDCARLLEVDFDDDECTGGVVYEVGAAVGGPYWCDGIGVMGEPLTCFELGAALPEIGYAEVAMGDARLGPLWITQGAAPVSPTDRFYDRQLDTVCRPDPTGAEPLRCNPDIDVPPLSGGWYEVFEDTACEKSLGSSYKSGCGEPTSRFRRDGSGFVRMRENGSRQPGPAYAGISVAPGLVLECTIHDDLPTTLFHADPLPSTDLAEITEVVR